MSDMSETPSHRSYLTGLVLALILTAIPFGLVAAKALPAAATYGAIAVAALVQIVVHLRFFLHLGFRQIAFDLVPAR
ncbi:MAG: cytochrome C oxidase subunit IV family protein, partial [Alphaproteobacteria bacterium]